MVSHWFLAFYTLQTLEHFPPVDGMLVEVFQHDDTEDKSEQHYAVAVYNCSEIIDVMTIPQHGKKTRFFMVEKGYWFQRFWLHTPLKGNHYLKEVDPRCLLQKGLELSRCKIVVTK